MGLLSFMKDAGEKLFGIGKAKAAEQGRNAGRGRLRPSSTYIVRARASTPAGLNDQLRPGQSAAVTVDGTVADQATKEKVLLCCGNVAGVASVNDLLVVETPAPEAQWHTVVSGDNLSKIAKKFYGDANKYPVIFEANKPMLTHPDKIYPGQMLRIPPL
jgi:nucleoid-associated protein YgaU